MKITHEKLVKQYETLGYEWIDYYPGLEITIMQRGEEYITIKGSQMIKGRVEP